MFVGHYGPAAMMAHHRIKLWHGFIAVQFLDILWAPLIILGVEKVRIVENFTASNHFDLYHMPYTHSFVMAVLWSVVAALLYKFIRKQAGNIGAAIIGFLVLSHWLLDYLMHKPDLELWFGGPKVGLGLWDNRPLSVGMELGFLAIGLGIYLLRTQSQGVAGRLSPFILFLVLGAAQLYGNFGPPPEHAIAAAQSAILAYVIAALLAAWVDATRSAK